MSQILHNEPTIENFFSFTISWFFFFLCLKNLICINYYSAIQAQFSWHKVHCMMVLHCKYNHVADWIFSNRFFRWRTLCRWKVNETSSCIHCKHWLVLFFGSEFSRHPTSVQELILSKWVCEIKYLLASCYYITRTDWDDALLWKLSIDNGHLNIILIK